MNNLFSTQEAADFLHVSIRTFKYWIKATSTQPVQIGARGAKFYSPVQLEDLRSAMTCAKALVQSTDLHTSPVQNTPRPVQSTRAEVQSGVQSTHAEVQSSVQRPVQNDSGVQSGVQRPVQNDSGVQSGVQNDPCNSANCTGENINPCNDLCNFTRAIPPVQNGNNEGKKITPNSTDDEKTIIPNDNDTTELILGQLSRENFDTEYLRLIESDIADSQTHLDEIPEKDRRGLTLTTLRHFHCGYLPHWVLTKSRAELSCGLYLNDNGETKHLPPPSPRIIIPTAGNHHFNAVATSSARRSIDKRFWKQHAGVMTLFFDIDTNLDSDTVFIVEGEFDAMSIWQASGGKIAVAAILGCMNWKRTLLPKLPELRGKRFILLLDSDSAGNQAAKKLLKELLQRGFLAVKKTLFDILHKEEQNYFGHTVDANDILVQRGNDYLFRILHKISDDAESAFVALQERITEQNPFAEGSDPDITALPSKKPEHNTIRIILNDFVFAKNLTRDEWCSVGMILKRYGFDLEDFKQWSKDDPRYSADVCASQWNSFKSAKELRGEGYTIATLIKIAKKFGYKPRHSKSPVDDSLLLSSEQRDFLFGGDLSDLDNARRIEFLYGKYIRFVTNRNQWLTFNNGLWSFCDEGNSAILPATTDLADKLIANADTSDERKIGQRLKMAQTRESAIKTLRGLNSIRITVADLNTHNNLFNCKNGVVDLQTGKFYDVVEPKLLLTQQCNAFYRPDYHNEIVDKFFRDILPDEPTRAALIRFLAYAATGECSEERALFCNGDGGNGKGTLTKTTLLLFGSYATTLKTSAVLLTGRTQDAGAATTELNPLENCRLAIVEELPQGGKLDVAKFKNLTGGDLIPIRRLHQFSPVTTCPNCPIPAIRGFCAGL